MQEAGSRMGVAEDPVLVERAGDIATVILNRPAKLNAMNRAMARRLAEEMNGLAADSAVKCVLMRGSGKAESTAVLGTLHADVPGRARTPPRMPAPDCAALHAACKKEEARFRNNGSGPLALLR